MVLERAEKVAKALKRFLDRKDASQKVKFNNMMYPKAEDWQFVGAFFGHTALVRSTEELHGEDGVVIGYVAIADVLHRGAKVSSAESACMRDEPNWSKKPAFQLRSMAQTRACAKALRNVFAWVMVMAGLAPTPAEELQDPAHITMPRPCYDCGEDVGDVEAIANKKKYGKAICRVCAKSEERKRAAKVMEPLSDPDFVAKSVQAVRQRAQPVARVIDQPWKDEITGD